MFKHCNKCDSDKEENDFAIKGNGRHTICKECHREYSKNHYNINRNRYIERNLMYQPKIAMEIAEYITKEKSRPCKDCNNTFPTYVMDFDHVKGKKITEISEMVRRKYKLETIKAEIEKCELVCSNCHRIRTYTRYLKIEPEFSGRSGDL